MYTYDSRGENSGEKDKRCYTCDRAYDIESDFNKNTSLFLTGVKISPYNSPANSVPKNDSDY